MSQEDNSGRNLTMHQTSDNSRGRSYIGSLREKFGLFYSCVRTIKHLFEKNKQVKVMKKILRNNQSAA